MVHIVDPEQVSDNMYVFDLESWNQICPVNELSFENTKEDFFLWNKRALIESKKVLH